MKKGLKSFIFVLLILQLLITFNVIAEVEFSQELYEKLSNNVNKIPHIDITGDYERVEFDNGMVVYLMEDHELPLIMVSGYIKGGRSQEIAELAGISDFMVDMMNTGTKQYGERELDYYKQLNAISFGLSVSDNSYSFGGSALISEKDELISLAADILKNPNFKANYYNRILNEWVRSLQQSKTQEGSLANMYFYNNIFNDHPYSYSTNYDLRLAALKNINATTLSEYYQANIIPNNTIFIVYGDIDTNGMVKQLKKSFADWESKESELREPGLNIDESIYNKIILVNKPDATQARIKMGYNFYSEDYFDKNLKEKVSFKIANAIYGGGDFESYLLKEIRSEKGYAYDISSGFFNSPLGGAYYINTGVKPDKAYDTIMSARKIMTDLSIGKINFKKEEVFEIINQWNAYIPESYKNKSDILNYIISTVEIDGRDKNYINNYIQEYNKVTAEDVQEAFSTHVYPDKFFTVIVGKVSDILPQFKEKGIEVQVINNFGN